MEQIYTPTVIADTPFPQTDQLQTNPTQQISNQTYGQQTIQASSFPEPVIAQELLSTALNTRSKKIIQEFQFAQSGALQIGDYTQGVNGDIRISPTGITARDLAGNVTFDIDGDTGDALFAGEVRDGSTVTGSVTVLNGGHIILYDATGIPSIFIGQTA